MMKFYADYSPAEQYSLKNEICDKCNENQINHFLRVCESKGVDPFSGLLYVAVRGGKATVSSRIDAKRAAAARSQEYAGSDEPEYDSEENDKPVWCRVTIYRIINGERCAFTAKCRFKEFTGPNWANRPYHMLGITTEAQALRKGFPDFVVSVDEDLENLVDLPSDNLPPEQKQVAVDVKIRWAKAVGAFTAFKKSEADLLKYLNIESKDQVTDESLSTLEFWYDELKNEKVVSA